MCQTSIDPEFPSTHVFVIIRFSATNWQEWYCCECMCLSICAALNQHQESINIPAYYHDNGRKLALITEMQFLKSDVWLLYFTCGNKKRLVPCHQPAYEL